ncbi:ATP-binding protein [Actinoplanes sp. NPDC051851]|uniref:sensor histidine kinase n=1 Tax=Actinoplanes sp. NPDC051851 TaxID=3154753 RepID=UPI00343E1DA0
MSLRLRMTLLYGGLFTLLTSGILVIVEQLQIRVLTQHLGDAPATGGPEPPRVTAERLQQEILKAEEDLTQQQRRLTVIAVVVLAVLAFAVCWWLTGRLLHPLQHITGTARRLSLTNLDERIALTGPADEVRELADTFDAMLDRLEKAVVSQRRFVAHASHELRTPLAVQRTALEIGLADPTRERLEVIRRELLRNTERSERLIDGLLTLAQGERALDARDPVDLAAVVDQVVEDHLTAGVELTVTTAPLLVAGEEVLLARLAANLVQNAVRHNVPGGGATVDLAAAGVLTVRNTGPHVDPDAVDGLFAPFERLGEKEGAGLGLSIVAAIAEQHDATVEAAANPDGGLTVRVTFTPLPAPPPG